LLIAGFGSPELEHKCNQLICNENVKYFGKVDYKTALNIMYNSDIIYAMYSKSNPNHIYAAPNKYYEAMMLGKPIISNSGTILENKILKANIGFIVDETLDVLVNQINKLERKLMDKKGIEARKLWENKFSNYTQIFMDSVYYKIISKENQV
jgi:glycosyltransferase involved in cell wall biosynthesis